MATEYNVNDLLENLGGSKEKKETKKPKEKSDWAEEEETGFGLGGDMKIVQKKTTKKKTQVKGWGDVDEDKEKKAPVQDLAKIQDQQEKKKGIMSKPGQHTQQKAAVIEDEYFPSIGEKVEHVPKKKPEPTPTPSVTTTDIKKGAGPLRFVNAHKKGEGEHFVPLDPKLTEKPVPEQPKKEVVENGEEPKKTPGIFSRKTDEAPKETVPPADSKFKFGGEGPKKFSAGSKISFKREEEKNEAEELRLKKEREIEEKLEKEREEAAKQREIREQRKKEREAQGGDQKPEKTEKHERPEKQEKNGAGDHEEKKITRFTNQKKDGEKTSAPRKISNEKPQIPVEKPAETTVDPKANQPKEKIEVHGTLSNKGWGDGAILKKTVKK